MEERALTVDELIAAMHDIRLPADAPGGVLAELFAAIGLGLFLALVLSFVLDKVTEKQSAETAETAETLEQRMESARNLQGEERVLTLLHILKEVDPARAKSLSASFYEPDSLPEIQTIESAIRSAPQTHV